MRVGGTVFKMILFYIVQILDSCMILPSCTTLLTFYRSYLVIIRIYCKQLLLNTCQVVVPDHANLGDGGFTLTYRSWGCGVES